MKSHWNYRIMRHEDPLTERMAKVLRQEKQVWYGLHEVHYKDGKPHGWTEDSVIGGFGSAEDLISALGMMVSDVKKHTEVLEYESQDRIEKLEKK